jgi:hypothetical protein
MNIRSSSLPSYSDCPRRAASKAYKQQIETAGFTLRQLPSSIGAAIGTGVHRGASVKTTSIIYGESVSDRLCIDASIEEFRTLIVDGATMDNTTDSVNTGEKQIVQLVKSFIVQVAPDINPEFADQKYEPTLITIPGVEINEEITTSGSSDIETADGVIVDLKTGAKYQAHHAQMGDYALLKDKHSTTKSTGARCIYLPRTSIKKTYPGPMVFDYDLQFCKSAAMAIIKQVAGDYAAWLRTLSPWAFPANPMSVLCSDKYCPAWGTEFCKYGIKK